jgi:hypothetical protein
LDALQYNCLSRPKVQINNHNIIQNSKKLVILLFHHQYSLNYQMTEQQLIINKSILSVVPDVKRIFIHFLNQLNVDSGVCAKI